jgi:hypothetical protein
MTDDKRQPAISWRSHVGTKEGNQDFQKGQETLQEDKNNI